MKLKFSSVLILFIVSSTSLLSNEKIYDEVGEKFDKQQRFEYINDLRGGNDGINWQLIDRETRSSRYDRLKNESIKNKNTLQLQHSFANGSMEGSWMERGSNNQSGRTRFVDVDFEDELLYCATDGGNVFRGTMEGKNWTCLNNYISFNNIKAIKIFKENGKRIILVTTSNTYYYSENEGVSWTQTEGLEAIFSWGSIKKSVVANDENETIYVLGEEWDYGADWCIKSCLYYSIDKGKTFLNIFTDATKRNCMDIWSQRYDTDDSFFIKADSMFSLIDGNKVFWKVMGEKNGSSPFANYSNSEKENINLYVSGAGDGTYLEFALYMSIGSQSYYAYSQDAGDSWEVTGTLDKTVFMSNSFTTSTLTASYMYMGAVELYMSTTAGNSWDIRNQWSKYYQFPKTELHADIPAVQFFRNGDNNELMYISTDGGLYVSDDYGKNVENIALEGLNCSQYYSCLTSEKLDVLYAGAQDQGFQRANNITSEEDIYDFIQLFSGDYGSITSADDGESLWSVYPNFLLYMENADKVKKWPNFHRWSYEGSNWPWMMPVQVYPGDPKIVHACGGGDNWGDSHLWYFTYDITGEIVAIKKDRNFHRDTDFGNLVDLTYDKNKDILLGTEKGWMIKYLYNNQWEDYRIYSGDNNFVAKSILVDKIDNNTIYAGGRGYNTPGAFVSYNAGESFEEITDGLPNTYINRLAISNDGNMLFAATSTGPYVYVKIHNQWYDLTTSNSPDQDFRWVEWVESEQVARFATYGRGIWDFKVESFKTDIKEDEKVIKFDVSAFPNPMNDNTKISFEMPASSYGTVKVFDIQGNEVNRLFEGNFIKGINEFNFNGDSHKGYNLPTGTYIVIASTNGYSNFVKLIKN